MQIIGMVGTMDVLTRGSWLVIPKTMIEKETRSPKAAAGMTWVEFKVLLVEEFCPSNKMEKLEIKMHQKVGILTDEAVRCGTLTRSSEKRKEVEETSKQGARGRAFNVNAFDALQDPNVVTGTFSLNNHFDTILFDSGVDFSFISTKFAPLLNVKPSIVSPGYVIEVANDLIPMGHGSFDVIVGMDWLSKNKAEIVCHEKVVRIPLEGGGSRGSFEVGVGAAEEGEVKEVLNMRQRWRIDVILATMSREIAIIQFGVNRMIPGSPNVRRQGKQNTQQRLHGLDQQMEGIRDESLSLWIAIVKVEHQRPLGLLQQPQIPEWKWDNITMDFITKLHRSKSGHDIIWVVVDRLTKLTYFLTTHEDYNMVKLARLYIDEIIARHRVPVSIISDRDGLFTSCFWSPILWAEIGESRLIGPELVQETTNKVVLIKEKLKAVRVSPWKGVIHFRKKGKLAPRFVGPFEILERIDPVAYRLRLLEELSSVHDTFYVSNLKKSLADAYLHVSLDNIKINKNLCFVEEQ
ncbi:putative reverse transcriptase domain-containing protein [Tanacetum coccineum]